MEEGNCLLSTFFTLLASSSTLLLPIPSLMLEPSSSSSQHRIKADSSPGILQPSVPDWNYLVTTDSWVFGVEQALLNYPDHSI